MRRVDRVLQRIGVQPAERALCGWAGLCLLLLGAAAFALLNAAETLFLKRVGVEALPVALLASSGLLILTTAGVIRIASGDPPRWLPRILAGLALAPFPFVWLVGEQSSLVFGALVLVARQVLALGLLAFWLAMGSLVPARRAKQLFAPLAAGVTLGGILGSFGSDPMARLLGLDGLIALCAAVLAGSALMGRALRRSGTLNLVHALGAGAGAAPPSALRSGFVDLLRGSRLFRLLAVPLLCAGALYPVLYFEFTSVLDAATQGPGGEQQMLSLYSQFRGWLNVAMLGSQLWLTTSLYRRFGVPLTLTLWPLAYLLGFTWLALDFALLAALSGFGAARVSEEGIGEPGARVLSNLFPDATRASATGLLVGPVNRIGGVLGNGFVLGALALGAAGWVGPASLPLAGLWLAAALLLWRAYPGLLLRASAEHGLSGAGIDRAVLLDPATLRSLSASLVDPDPRMCRAAVDLVKEGEPAVVLPLLTQAIEAAPAANRPVLVEALVRCIESDAQESAGSAEAARSLERMLRARPPLPGQERAELLRAYARLTAGSEAAGPGVEESKALLERALGDRAAPVRLAAIAELHRRGAPPPGLPDLDRTLTDALAAADALIRRSARKELRAILLTSVTDERWTDRLRVLAQHLEQRADRAETAEALRDVARRHGNAAQSVVQQASRYAADRDPRVRGALIAAAGHAGLADAGPRLVSSLGARAPEEADGARDGLVALGPSATLPLLAGLELGGPARREAALAVVRELEVDAGTLSALVARQLEAIRERALLRAAVDELPGGLSQLLRRRLDERIAEGLGALLDLLSALRSDPRLAELERGLRRSGGGRERDLLVEAIEAVLDRGEREAIVPLLEPGSWAEKGVVAADALGRRRPGPRDAVAELCSAEDATTRQLARMVSLEWEEGMGEARPMPSAMDVAVRLQDVPAFDRLGTQRLLALAELLQEQKLAEGERVYAAGEEGLGLYFVLEGEVELRRGELVLERAGAGSFFGERSALDGLPRGADAIASATTRLLRLDRDDLLRLLDEAPGLAVALAQVLSSRMRRLEDRLAASLAPSEHGS